MFSSLIRLVQGLCLIPSTGLFIALLTHKLRHDSLGLEWPSLLEPGSNPAIELALASLPGLLAFLLLAASGLLRRGKALPLLLGYSLCASLAAYCAVSLFASSYGNTWSATEIFRELLLNQLNLLGLAILPGLIVARLLDRLLRRPT